MNIRQRSFIRDAVGFFAGGILAAISTGLIFLAFIPLENINDGRNHAPEACILTVLVMFFCGGFIGRRGFSAEAWADFLPSIIGTYVTILGLPLLVGLSLGEALPFVGFGLVGAATTVAASVLFLKWFPLETPYEKG